MKTLELLWIARNAPVWSRTLRQVRIGGSFSSRSGDYAVGSVPPPGINRSASPSAHASLVAPAIVAPAIVAIPARGGCPADGSQVLTARSFNGRWLALRATDSDQANTRIVVIDTSAMRPVADRWIGGAFALDAISADGRLVYLIQSLPTRGYGVYQVRSYQVGHTGVDARVVVAPGEVPGSMSGGAWSRAWSPDGSWLYTLYIQGSGHVFVHALHLAARETRCIDFPALSGSVQEASHFTLSVARMDAPSTPSTPSWAWRSRCAPCPEARSPWPTLRYGPDRRSAPSPPPPWPPMAVRCSWQPVPVCGRSTPLR